jgi:hypothetical protein
VRLITVSRADLRENRTGTGEDGSFVLSPVAAGSYRLEAAASGFAAAQPAQPVTVADQPVEGIKIVLRRGAVVGGRVLGLSPEELAAVAVTAHGEAGEERTAWVGPDGSYEVRDLPAGDWLLRAALWQGQRQVEERVPVAPGDRQVRRDLEFSRRVTLSGRVLFEDEPLAGSTVSVRGEHFSIERSVTSGFDGSFVVQDLEPDVYWVGVRSAERLLVYNDTLELKEDREVTLRLEAGTVAGRVLGAHGGDAIPGAALALRPAAGADFMIGDVSLADGAFRIIHVPPGSYRLSARADGYAPAEREVHVSGGEELSGLELELNPTSGLEIRIRLASGQVPPMVHVQARSGQGIVALAASYVPKPDGGLRLASLPAGSWQLVVGAPGGAPVELPIDVPGTGKPLAVTLPGAGRLQVRVAELATQNQLATLRLLRPDQSSFWTLGPGGTVEQSWTLRGGKGTVDGLPAGQWLAVVETADGRVWQGAVATPGGGEVTLSLD